MPRGERQERRFGSSGDLIGGFLPREECIGGASHKRDRSIQVNTYGSLLYCTANADVAMNEFSVECNGATHNADNRDDLSLLDVTASLYLDNKWWMRLFLSHPPKSRRLLVVGPVSWIIGGLN